MESEAKSAESKTKQHPYSFGSFSGRTFCDRKPEEFSGATIEGSCFSQETPDTQVFPDGVKGVTFAGCNLDNVRLPEGSVLTDLRGNECTNKSYSTFHMAYASGAKGGEAVKGEDGAVLSPQNWELDKDGNPSRPMEWLWWEKSKRSTDPKSYALTPARKE